MRAVRDQYPIQLIFSRGWSGDGGPATAALLNDPHQVAPLAGGGFLIADTGNNVIRKVDAEGVITTVAGTPMEAGDTGDGGRATGATLDQPMGVADLGGGAFAIADTGNHAVRIVSADGSITTAGDPSDLQEPRALAFDDGTLAIADAALNRVFGLSAAGALSTLAGTGSAGLTGDGGPAADAELNHPTSVAFDDAGALVIADSGNRLVRRIDGSGIITTVVALPGPAAAAPVAVAVGLAPDGGVLAGDGPKVSDIGAAGEIDQVAGTGYPGFNGDSGVATAVALGAANGVAGTSDGSVLISDGADDRVRQVSTDGQLTTVAGSGRPLAVQVTAIVLASTSGAPVASGIIRYDVGQCRGFPAFLGAYAVSFPYTLTPPIPAQRRATIVVYSSADAYLTLTITGAHAAARHMSRTVSQNSTLIALGTLKPGTYKLAVRAHYRDPRKGSEYACATDSIRVR